MIRCRSCKANNDKGAEACVRCGRSLYALAVGEVLDARYEILAVLGQGGMGVVYEAHDRELDETVAVKILRASYAGSALALRRLRAEIKLARKVRDPRVCAIHEFGREDHLAYIVMELVTGRDLRSVIRRHGVLGEHDACALGTQLCQALEAIHQAGIVHRDLKPANVMIDSRRVVRLMDFGIAKGIEGGLASVGTATGVAIGTPEYMSPEQARGGAVDVRSDLYALGIILFELATGTVPFSGETPIDTMRMQISEEPAWDGATVQRLPPGLQEVLRRALAKKPEDRFQSPFQMREALERLCAQAPTAQGLGALVSDEPRRAPRPHPRATAGSGVPAEAEATRAMPPGRARLAWLAVPPLILLASGALWWSTRHRPETPPAPGTTAPQPRPAGSAEPRSPERRATEGPAPSPSPSRRPGAADRSSAPPRIEVTPARPGRSITDEPRPEDSASGSGRLAFLIIPWAHVSVDGQPVGTTPLRPLRLTPGRHTVVLRHPAYEPLRRRVEVVEGKTTTLEVDLEDVAFPRPPPS